MFLSNLSLFTCDCLLFRILIHVLSILELQIANFTQIFLSSFNLCSVLKPTLLYHLLAVDNVFKYTNSCYLILGPLSFVGATIFDTEDAIPVSFIILPLTFVHVTVFKVHDAVALTVAEFPLSIKDTSIPVLHNSKVLRQVLPPFSFVNVSVWISDSTITIKSVILPFAIESLSV